MKIITCDRCGYKPLEPEHFQISITTDQGLSTHEYDLCAHCEDAFLAFVGGRKLAPPSEKIENFFSYQEKGEVTDRKEEEEGE